MPYLNVSARWEGAPDQNLLQEKGGRGFPYCTIMNAEGDVIWEVRPTSREVLHKGLEDAKVLDALMQRAAKAPDDKGLAASVALLSEMGKGQRQLREMDELQKLFETKGLDPEVKERFEPWFAAKRFDQRIRALDADAKTPEAFHAAVLALYEEGVRPPEGARYVIPFWLSATEGAIQAGKQEVATACLGELDEMAKSNARLRRDVDRLKKALKDG